MPRSRDRNHFFTKTNKMRSNNREEDNHGFRNAGEMWSIWDL